MKRMLAMLLAVAMSFTLAACGSKKDVSGIGSVALEDGDESSGGIGKLGGSDGSGTSEQTPEENPEKVPAPEPSPQEPSPGKTSGTLTTEHLENEKYAIDIPSGWIYAAVEGDNNYVFAAYDPADTDSLFYVIISYGPFYASEESRSNWATYVNPVYAYAPVLAEPTAANFLLSWEQCRVYQQQAYGEASFGDYKNFEIVDDYRLSGGVYEQQFGAVESMATASCIGPSGNQCGSLAQCAMILQNEPTGYIQGDSNYYISCGNYLIFLSADRWDQQQVIYDCAKSFTVKSNSNQGVTQGITQGELSDPAKISEDQVTLEFD